jgi:hypothetical protein
MLHTSRPSDYISAEKLAEPAICPECDSRLVLAIGVIHLGHYQTTEGIQEGLLWTCSDRCFLSWESNQFMARA